MHPRDGDLPTAAAEAGVSVANDRRRAGRRQTVNPQLRALLRGQVDPDAPIDPLVKLPTQNFLERDLVSGALIAATLLLAGAVLRFAA